MAGWSGSEWDLYARFVPFINYDSVAAVRSSITGKWFIVSPISGGVFLNFFFLDGPMTFAEVKAAGQLEPD